MVRAAVTVRRIAMARQNDLRLELCSADNGRVEVVDFKPQEDPVARNELWIADWAVMMLHIPAMQLKYQPAVRNQPLILRPAVPTLTANIAHANKWLWTHTELVA
jgi:hypothetical protein